MTRSQSALFFQSPVPARPRTHANSHGPQPATNHRISPNHNTPTPPNLPKYRSKAPSISPHATLFDSIGAWADETSHSPNSTIVVDVHNPVAATTQPILEQQILDFSTSSTPSDADIISPLHRWLHETQREEPWAPFVNSGPAFVLVPPREPDVNKNVSEACAPCSSDSDLGVDGTGCCGGVVPRRLPQNDSVGVIDWRMARVL